MAFEKLTQLFVYGTLSPSQPAQPRTMRGYVSDKVQGRLLPRSVHPYPQVVGVGVVLGWVEGYTISIDERELSQLDKYEGSSYRRIKTITYLGFEAWIYEGTSSSK